MGKIAKRMMQPSVSILVFLGFICAIGGGYLTRMAFGATSPAWEQNYLLGAVLCGVAMAGAFFVAYINFIAPNRNLPATTLTPIK